jgi:hypothetical protein
MQMRAGRAFLGFQEARVAFAPTFKYDVGTQVSYASQIRRPTFEFDITKEEGQGHMN